MHDKTVNLITFKSTSITRDIASSRQQATHEHQQIIAEVENASTVKHAETRAIVISQAATLQDCMVALHKETRAAIASAGDDGLVILQRLTDHVMALQTEVRQQHAIERERTRDELLPWIAALMVQNTRVIEAHQAAAVVAGQATSGKGRNKAREALEHAGETLKKAIQILIEVAEIFEKEIGLRYTMISDLIAESVHRVNATTFIKDLFTCNRTGSQLSNMTDIHPLDVWVVVDGISAAGLERRDAHGCLFVPFGELTVPLKIAREEYQPLWGLYCTESRLEYLTLDHWANFKDQRWMYVHI